jgi:prepilin-type N-terminal cleavage/methylation domain-containing protein
VNRARFAERGFTLAEVLVATFVLAVGLTAVITGLQYARSGLETARGETTAAFLAEQRLEHLKAVALANWPAADLRAGTTVEDYGSIAGAPVYRRVTTIADSPGGACAERCKLAWVTVFYRPVTASGQLDQERRLDVVTMLVSRI